MTYGSWSVEEEHTLRADDGGWRTDFIARPPDEEARDVAERQGMMGVGTLSSLYSSMFHAATLTADGHVKQLEDPPVPGIIGALIPADYWEQDDRRLSLGVWRCAHRTEVNRLASLIERSCCSRCERAAVPPTTHMRPLPAIAFVSQPRSASATGLATTGSRA